MPKRTSLLPLPRRSSCSKTAWMGPFELVQVWKEWGSVVKCALLASVNGPWNNRGNLLPLWGEKWGCFGIQGFLASFPASFLSVFSFSSSAASFLNRIGGWNGFFPAFFYDRQIIMNMLLVNKRGFIPMEWAIQYVDKKGTICNMLWWTLWMCIHSFILSKLFFGKTKYGQNKLDLIHVPFQFQFVPYWEIRDKFRGQTSHKNLSHLSKTSGWG